MYQSTEQKTQGVISRLMDKGYGFIAANNGKEVFFHASSLNVPFDALNCGETVEFQIVRGDRGPKAVNVGVTSETKTEQEAKELFHSDTSTSAITIAQCTKQLLRHLQSNPRDLYKIHPKTFEEIVATIFRSEGFDTEFLGSWNQADGGVDVIAVRKLVDGVAIRVAIQCKRYSEERKITADPIRSLAGVLDRFRAHVGVVATTSYFTEPAETESERHLWRIGLRDYNSIVKSLREREFLP